LIDLVAAQVAATNGLSPRSPVTSHLWQRFMYSSISVRLALVAAFMVMFIPDAQAVPADRLVDEVLQKFFASAARNEILDAASTLFWALASMSLVWTMGMLIVRQDIGEMLMELLRFIVVTGTFYWLLINASGRAGGNDFVGDIVTSFFVLLNGDTSDSLVTGHANEFMRLGYYLFANIVEETKEANTGDRIVACSLAIGILVVLVLVAAQFLLALVMAWMLGYAGIFLLGFGGARWTSQIAVSFYKHVLAIGVSLLALGIIGTIGTEFLQNLDDSPSSRASVVRFSHLGLILAGAILMLVLSLKIPHLLYTLVTGSPLGLFAGTASMAGSAIATGSSAAYASATGWGQGGGHSPADGRTGSVMDAVQRSAGMSSGMSDPFGVARAADPYRSGGGGSSAFGGSSSTASDPFGVARSADPYRSGGGGGASAATATGSPAPVARAGESTHRGEHVPDAPASSIDNQTAGTAAPSVQHGAVDALAADRTELPEGGGSSPSSSRPDYETDMAAIAQTRGDSGITPSTLTAVTTSLPSSDDARLAGGANDTVTTDIGAAQRASATLSHEDVSLASAVDAKPGVDVPALDMAQAADAPRLDALSANATVLSEGVQNIPTPVIEQMEQTVAAPAPVQTNHDTAPSIQPMTESPVARAATVAPVAGQTQALPADLADTQVSQASIAVPQSDVWTTVPQGATDSSSTRGTYISETLQADLRPADAGDESQASIAASQAEMSANSAQLGSAPPSTHVPGTLQANPRLAGAEQEARAASLADATASPVQAPVIASDAATSSGVQSPAASGMEVDSAARPTVAPDAIAINSSQSTTASGVASSVVGTTSADGQISEAPATNPVSAALSVSSSTQPSRSVAGLGASESPRGDLKAAEPARSESVELPDGAKVIAAQPADAEATDVDERARKRKRKSKRPRPDIPEPNDDMRPEDDE